MVEQFLSRETKLVGEEGRKKKKKLNRNLFFFFLFVSFYFVFFFFFFCNRFDENFGDENGMGKIFFAKRST